MKHAKKKQTSRTVDQAEISRFSAHADEWWTPRGKYAPLHKMTPARIGYLKEVLGPLKGMKILDIGCGGGLVAEPLCRLGAKVTGIDADPNAIRVASSHAKDQGLSITYREAAAEDLAQKGETFDAVLALEILEHVSDPAAFLALCKKLVKPEGKIIVSTLNRTWKSYAFGIVAAEQLLKWAPEDTHQWSKFLKPSELARIAENAGLSPLSATGLIYKPISNSFEISPHNLDINYFMVLSRSERR